MLKKLLVVAALFATGQAQATLNAGDIAFTSFNADEDGFAFTTFVDIAANSSIYFNDNEFVSGAFNTGEGQIAWNSGLSLIGAGSVIRFSEIDKATTSVNFGTFTKSGDTGLNATTDNLFAYLGTNATTPSTFLAAIANGVFGSGSGGSLISSLTDTGLTVGVNATQLTASADYGQYTGVRSGLTSFASYKPLIADNANWSVIVGGAQELQVPNTTSFTIAPVPEPETYAMLLAGLGLLSFASRRKQ